jgi:hypothetical protein
MRINAVPLLVLVALVGSCHTASKKGQDFPEARQLVRQTVARHPNLVRLTIHAVPAGRTDSRIIACNVLEKIGKLSDPEDLEAVKTGKTVVLREGNNLDVTAPILDKTGRAIAATGITLALSPGRSEKDLRNEADKIARELTLAIQAANRPLW